MLEYLPESPTGAEYVVPPVSLDEGPESGESNRDREKHFELAPCVFLCVCVCVCVCVSVFREGKAAAVRPSITPVKSMPNEDADDEAHTLARTHTHSQRTYRGEFLTPPIIPP